LQCAFPLDVLMVPSSVLTVAANGERLSCEFITDYFNGLSLSPRRDGSDAAVMGSSHSRPPSPLCAMIGDSNEEFHTASDGEGWIDLPSPRRHNTGGFTRPHHNHIVAGEYSDHSSYGDDSTATSGAVAGH
jgi:hypothetical protein